MPLEPGADVPPPRRRASRRSRRAVALGVWGLVWAMLGAGAPPLAPADPAPAEPVPDRPVSSGWNPATGDTARALAHPGDLRAGEIAYASCAVCHGADGSGRADGTFPRIAGQHASVIVKQIDDIRNGRRGNPVMASHVSALTDPAEMADVAAYIESLAPEPDGDASPSPTDATGAAVYQRDCAPCHGANGEGDAAAFVPVIAGQHEAYLLRQLRAIAGSLRRNAHPGMVDVTYDKRDETLRAVARYLAALPWPQPDGGE